MPPVLRRAGLALLLLPPAGCAPLEAPAAGPRVLEGIGPVQVLEGVEYVEVNGPASGAPPRPLLVFVHGTPGSLSAFRRYLGDPLLRERFHMIAVTRPGWAGDGTEPLLERQARALAPFLRRDRTGRGAILMGHSYGGPVIARAAMDHPELVAGLAFVASTGDPALSGPRWYNRMAAVAPRFLLGGGLAAANVEIMAVRPQLEEMLPRWRDLTMPALVVQGGRDRLVHPDNAAFIEEALSGAPVTSIRLRGKGHFILWREAELIRDALIRTFAPAVDTAVAPSGAAPPPGL